MSARKATRPPKAQKPSKALVPAARSFAVVQRDFHAAREAMKRAIDRTGRVQDELESFPEHRKQMAEWAAQRDREQKAKLRAEQKAAEKESKRKAAKWPMAKNPLLDDSCAESSAHQLACALDYWSRLELTSEDKLPGDTVYGGYLLRQVFVDAAYKVEDQISREWQERRERAEQEKAKGGAP